MKLEISRTAFWLVVSTFVGMGDAIAYQRCATYEYAELKEMSAKQLEIEYCKAEQRVNEIYGFIGANALKDERTTDQAVRDRDECWDVMEKLGRLPRFKQVKTACPDVKKINPIDAALEQAKRDLAETQSRSKAAR